MKYISLGPVVALLLCAVRGAADDGGLSPSRLSKLGLAGLEIAEGSAADPEQPAEELMTNKSEDGLAQSSTELSQLTRTVEPLRNLSLPTIEDLLSPATGGNSSLLDRKPASATDVTPASDQLNSDSALKKLGANVALRRQQWRQALQASELAAREVEIAAARRMALQNEIARLERELAAATEEVEEKTLAARVAAAQLARQRSALAEVTAEQPAAAAGDPSGLQTDETVPDLNPLRLGAFPD